MKWNFGTSIVYFFPKPHEYKNRHFSSHFILSTRMLVDIFSLPHETKPGSKSQKKIEEAAQFHPLIWIQQRRNHRVIVGLG